MDGETNATRVAVPTTDNQRPPAPRDRADGTAPTVSPTTRTRQGPAVVRDGHPTATTATARAPDGDGGNASTDADKPAAPNPSFTSTNLTAPDDTRPAKHDHGESDDRPDVHQAKTDGHADRRHDDTQQNGTADNAKNDDRAHEDQRKRGGEQ